MDLTRSELVTNFLKLKGSRITDVDGMLTHVIVSNVESTDNAYPLTISSDESDGKELHYD